MLPVLAPGSAAAHALGSSFPLPVPLWLYLIGAAVAVGASFVVAVVVVKAPSDPPRYPTRPLAPPVVRVGGVALRLLGLVWWYGAIVTGLVIGGITYIPAVLFWIGIWVGVPIAAALFGNPWPALSPFRTTYDALDAIVRAHGAARWQISYCLPEMSADVANAYLQTYEDQGIGGPVAPQRRGADGTVIRCSPM